ncbi:growth hormone receptor isoform X1 [Astyanax mexicanus]|uniref:Growth hormone receptor isoform X1 n=1 Tax=Astyanax mexicanus TaxID=7994 RepID=A0A8T2LIC0_ASTMX|nr:growth hormone receptor isoform X1 [Astyanax mexicanus]
MNNNHSTFRKIYLYVCVLQEQAKTMERKDSLSLLCVLVCVWTQATYTQGSTQVPEDFTPEPIVLPHFTSCRSREQETFRCWWSTGSLANLSEPGALAVFFHQNNLMPIGWQECPEYTATVENECYFNKSFTHIWTSYCVQLRATSQNITYDEYCFTVENIVHPDPPVGLNWTLLNVSSSGINFDILVRWAPPPSADVQTGWMSLKYEVHYRVRNASHWDKLELESGSQQSIYGLQTDKEYEVRIRCKMSAFDNFGDFSESVFVQVAPIPTKVSVFPMALLLVFGVVGMLFLLVLIIFSQQQRLMVILLPPVPAPKIKGIDPELLKKGKMDQLNSLLSSQHMYNHDTYREDPWVEFIQLDLDDACEKNENSDTRRLLGLTRPGLKGDDDSGRASCYDPDFLPDTEGLLAAHSEMEERHPLVSESSPSTPSPELAETPFFPVQSQPVSQSWINMDFYAQVSDVTPAGAVVLSPGQQNDRPSKNPVDKTKKEEEEAGKEEEHEKKMKLQLLVVDPDRGYSHEVIARQVESSGAPFCSAPEIAYHTLPPEPAEEPHGWHGEYLAPDGEAQMEYFLPEAPPASMLPPVSDYTVVQEVDDQRSLLLNPSARQSPACPPNPIKHLPSMPAVPVGYLTPELLENLSP